MKTMLFSLALSLASFAAQAQTQTQTFAPSKTGNISTGNINFGQSFLTVAHKSGQVNIGLLQFDLSALDSNRTYEAKLDLHQYGASVEGSYWVLFANTEAWNANIGRWGARPSFDETLSTEFSIDDSNTGVWREANVSEIVNAWVSGGLENQGLTLMRADRANPGVFFGASHSDYSFAPRLVVTSAVPEPSVALMLGLGLAGLALRRRAR